MKKVLLIFAVAIVFISGCGGGSDSKDGKSAYKACEYGTYQCSGNSSYYCGYSGDNLIWQFLQECGNGCDFSTGKCKVENGSSGNNSNGTSNDGSQDEEDGKPETRTADCTGLPENAEWNAVSEITQTKEGSSWMPSTQGEYNTNASTTECRFKCVENYFWNGNFCVDPCESDPCREIDNRPPDGGCVGLDSNNYKCECSEGFIWNGEDCVDPCSPNPCRDIENSTGICNILNDGYYCECQDTFTWDGSKCLNPCDPNPCDAVENSTGICNKIDSFSKYRCECRDTFTWEANSKKCLNPCDPNPCEELSHSNGVCHKTDNFSQYSCDCITNYEWKISDCVGVTRTFTCSDLPARAEWNSVSSYTQRWNETDWFPPDSYATYNETASTTECRFKCKTGYVWNGSECTYPECSKDSYKPCVDSTTDLMWSSRSSNKRDWDWAVSYCESLSEGGFYDWRLPNIDELRKSVQNCPQVEFGGRCKVSEINNCLSFWDCLEFNGPCYCSAVDVDEAYFSKLGDYELVLWSSSIVSDYQDSVFKVMFSGEMIGNTENLNNPSVSLSDVKQSYSAYVRCVRDF